MGSGEDHTSDGDNKEESCEKLTKEGKKTYHQQKKTKDIMRDWMEGNS